AHLLRNIDEAREPTFSRNASCYVKELLLAVISLIAFDFAKRGGPRCTGSASRLRNFCHVRSYVFACQQLQSALRNNAFVIPMRNEEINTSRTPYRDLCI